MKINIPSDILTSVVISSIISVLLSKGLDLFYIKSKNKREDKGTLYSIRDEKYKKYLRTIRTLISAINAIYLKLPRVDQNNAYDELTKLNPIWEDLDMTLVELSLSYKENDEIERNLMAYQVVMRAQYVLAYPDPEENKFNIDTIYNLQRTYEDWFLKVAKIMKKDLNSLTPKIE